MYAPLELNGHQWSTSDNGIEHLHNILETLLAGSDSGIWCFLQCGGASVTSVDATGTCKLTFDMRCGMNNNAVDNNTTCQCKLDEYNLHSTTTTSSLECVRFRIVEFVEIVKFCVDSGVSNCKLTVAVPQLRPTGDFEPLCEESKSEPDVDPVALTVIITRESDSGVITAEEHPLHTDDTFDSITRQFCDGLGDPLARSTHSSVMCVEPNEICNIFLELATGGGCTHVAVWPGRVTMTTTFETGRIEFGMNDVDGCNAFFFKASTQTPFENCYITKFLKQISAVVTWSIEAVKLEIYAYGPIVISSKLVCGTYMTMYIKCIR